MTILSAGMSVAGLEACLLQVIPASTIANMHQTSPFFKSKERLENENLILDLVHAEELILRLTGAYKRQSHMFNTVQASTHAPQNLYIPGFEIQKIHARGMDYLPGVEGPTLNVVTKASKEHILFLFFATLTDRRQKSGGDFGVYASHCAIYRDYPELYTQDVITLDEEKLAKILRKYRIGVPNQSAGYWIRCAKTLFEKYEGDPVRLYESHESTVKGILTFKEQEKKLRKKNDLDGSGDPLPGYGPKIASLYSLFLDGLGALPFPLDAFPVDVQVQRLFIQYGAIILKTNASNALMEKVLRPFICLIAHYHGLNKQDISHAFWLLGSEACNSCSKKLNAPQMCPIYDDCRGCQNTANYFAKGYWGSADVPMKKGSDMVSFGMPEAKPVRYSRRPAPTNPQVLLFQE